MIFTPVLELKKKLILKTSENRRKKYKFNNFHHLEEKFLIQEAVQWHLTRLDAVKETLTPIFHDAILGELCDFIVSETQLEMWKN